MNCQTFEELIADLARNRVAEETVRSSALEHARACSRCGARLTDEQALTAMFAIAAEDRTGASARVEAAVMSAYRIHAANKAEQPVGPIARLRHPAHWAIAAMLLLSLTGGGIFMLLRNSEPSQGQVIWGNAGPGALANRPEAAVAVAHDVPRVPEVTRVTPRSVRRSPAVRKNTVQEITTDFIPLTADALSSMESGQLIRVRLPRTALAAYGLPVNQDLADRPVNAQVVVGQDGVARAIHFVADQNVGFVRSQR